MAISEEFNELSQQWTFSEEGLLKTREATQSCAMQALKNASAEGLTEGKKGTKDPPKCPDIDQGCKLVLFYAQKLPELCGLCGAPSEVRWTAIVFYRRFFAVRSPLEFDPMPTMFSSVFLACKVEEVHEITLDRILEAADFGADASLKAKVSGLELPLMEALGFMLLIEPKPDSGLQVLVEDLQQCVQPSGQGGGHPAETTPPRPGSLAKVLDEASRDEVLKRAEDFVVQLGVRTDAVLRWPSSVLLAGCLAAAMDAVAADHRGPEAVPEVRAPSEALAAMLDAGLEAEPHRSVFRRLLEEVIACAHSPESSEDVPQEAVKEAAKLSRKCQRAFERLREEASELHEAHRLERKRRWSQMKDAARRKAPTPGQKAFAAVQKASATRDGVASEA